MASKYANLLFSAETPQNQSVPSSVSTAKQVHNSAGGIVFALDKWKRLERFLILGSDSNTYYSSAPKLTKENAACVNECWTEDCARTAHTIATISREGRAARNSSAIFALALGAIHPNKEARQNAFAAVQVVCRTSTHLFEFVDTMKQLGKGWGRAMKNAVRQWYDSKTDEQLAYQLVKYRQREGWTHRDLLRKAHVTATTDDHKAMFDWLCDREGQAYPGLPAIIKAHIQAMVSTEKEHDDGVRRLNDLLFAYNLPWEALPTWANSKREVWEAMLKTHGVPLTAMLRNLGNFARLGVAVPAEAIDRLTTPSELQKARIHPFNILNAAKTYGEGKGFRGTNTWTPNRDIMRVLNESFFESFKAIKPIGKRIMLALDVSGSMNGSKLMNSALSAREASAAMAMATMRVEEDVSIVGFTSLHMHNSGRDISPLNINPKMTLQQICHYTNALPFSGTDCSLPMLYAMAENIKVDAFVIYTDSETWTGNIAPVEALRRYRECMGINAKLIVVGMTSTGFTIADPNDHGMLDIVGFDASAPAVIASFIAGSQALLEDHTKTATEEESQDSDGGTVFAAADEPDTE